VRFLKKIANANENHSHLGVNANENHSHLQGIKKGTKFAKAKIVPSPQFIKYR